MPSATERDAGTTSALARAKSARDLVDEMTGMEADEVAAAASPGAEVPARLTRTSLSLMAAEAGGSPAPGAVRSSDTASLAGSTAMRGSGPLLTRSITQPLSPSASATSSWLERAATIGPNWMIGEEDAAASVAGGAALEGESTIGVGGGECERERGARPWMKIAGQLEVKVLEARSLRVNSDVMRGLASLVSHPAAWVGRARALASSVAPQLWPDWRAQQRHISIRRHCVEVGVFSCGVLCLRRRIASRSSYVRATLVSRRIRRPCRRAL